MTMRTHELHPQLVHLPLALLPMAAATDLAAVLTRSRGLDRLGRSLWLLGCGGGIAAGFAGLAASQQVEVPEPQVDDMMYLHGVGNALILGASGALATWRLFHRATVRSTSIGISACAASLLTAHLGGELVYRHGVGVGLGASSGPKLLSRAAPLALARDALAGARWLALRTRALFSSEPLAPDALVEKQARRAAFAAGLGEGGQQTRH